MKKAALIAGMLFASGTALAADTSEACEKFRTDLTGKLADKCAEEAAKAKDAKCAKGSKADLNAMIKLFSACGKKQVAATQTPKKPPAKEGNTAGGSAVAKQLGDPCRAVALDGTTVLAEDKGQVSDCIYRLKHAIAENQCKDKAGQKVEFLLQIQARGTDQWTKGTKTSAQCKK